jgi:hypothetical protein
MPYINGLDLCKSIQDPYIQKILLTGIADEQVAVQAFNDGIINQYLRKDDLHLVEKLESALDKAQENYFKLISAECQRLITMPKGESSILATIQFQDLMSEIIKKYDIVEYYIMDSVGSYLLVDKMARDYGLFIANEQEMTMTAKELELENPQLAKLVKNREKVFCYHRKSSDMLPHVSTWENYLYQANKLEGKDTYYWALVPGRVNLQLDKLFSYQGYQNSASIKI